MKKYNVTKQRDGESEEIHNYYLGDFQSARKQFVKDMTQDLIYTRGAWRDGVGNEVDGFSKKQTQFTEDVYTYRLKRAR